MTLAIVILNWNGKKLLEQFLSSVVRYSPEAQLYIVDNASTDDSLDFVRTHFPEIHIVENPTNSGYAGGYNRALQHITTDVYCLLNSDVLVTEGWLSPILRTFEEERIAVVQPKIKDEKRRTHFEYAGAAGGFIDQYGFPYCRGRVFETIEEDKGQYNEYFFAHQEEIDLCWRVHHLGKQVVYCAESTVYHVGGATLTAANPKKTYLNFRNSLFMLLKNLPAKGLYTTIFLRMVLDGIAGVRFLLQGKPRFTWEVIRAHFHFYKRFFFFKKKRPSKLITNYYQVKSIVWEYFVLGVRG